jgi:hypothetical protein
MATIGARQLGDRENNTAKEEHTMDADNNANPRLKIAGYAVIAVNCQDSATARALAEQRLRDIEQRLAEIKKEKTALNRDKHCLTRWLRKNAAEPTPRFAGVE